jgi:hypothetical protein
MINLFTVSGRDILLTQRNIDIEVSGDNVVNIIVISVLPEVQKILKIGPSVLVWRDIFVN